MADDKQNSTGTDTAPADITAPAGSRADGVSEGANTNFGPTLDAVPHADGETKPSTEDSDKK
ncbi:MAG: hypothetical protein Q4C89_02565 [Deinococcus sp.]|uniref:hypothetical protein n=1 Tax=Deinococcus sp. TaxID=47478 RepID=UPI0026DC9484|nr:hypothetical protein [Deinococcus sp.]MDO4244888.1 hypothetical protein [Deinococcus sp.]